MLVSGAAALAATGPDAIGFFEQALAVDRADRWPFELARVELAYGERLRRDRATKASRRHLAAALETFESLGARPWAARAAGELRVIGLTSPRQSIPGPASLTAQEREIALLAATGLSNKQIGERLFLSHRTIGAHLYQIFPKLGITSRAALRDALANIPEPDKPGSSE
jgi:DNA-binding CsgD family transcriptional regulator